MEAFRTGSLVVASSLGSAFVSCSADFQLRPGLSSPLLSWERRVVYLTRREHEDRASRDPCNGRLETSPERLWIKLELSSRERA